MAAVILYQLTCAVLLLCVTSGRPSNSSEAMEVPFKLTVKSHNLNTTLHWDYNTTEVMPYFCVEMQDISEMEWMAIETCQNISRHFCDISHEILDPLNYYKVRVKAVVGPKISISATKEFSLSSVGIFGPPHLKVYMEEKIIVIDIFHPEVPSFFDIERHLNYMVYYNNITMKADDCDKSACVAEVSILDEGTYCFSAQGISDHFLMTMEKSEEMCIHGVKGSSKPTVKIIIVGVVGFLVILAIFVFIITRWTKVRTLLPPSLSSLVRNFPSQVTMPRQQTSTYNIISTSPIESPFEEKAIIDEEKADADMSNDSASKQSSDPGYHTSELTENEQKSDDQGNSSSYFHTDSSTNGILSNDAPESEKDEKISEQSPKPPKPLTNSFGYDKPHFPREFN